MKNYRQASFVFILLLYFAGCGGTHVQKSKSDERPVKIGGVKTDELIPPEATDIEYKSEDSGFGCSVEWKCSVKEQDFLNFAKKKHWKLLDKKPANVNICFYYRGTFEFPKNYFYYFAPTASSAGLYILYDKDTGILYGHYADR